MNRTDLQKLSDIRFREAKVLSSAGEYSGAYYLAGYAVECALKACFAKTIKRYDFPERDWASKVFTHKLPELAVIAKLKKDLDTSRQQSGEFEANWLRACQWTEESRYFAWTKDDAEAILDAIGRKKDGVLPWIKQRW